MEIICINDVFPPQVLQFYKEHGVQTPVHNTVYHVYSYRTNSVDGKLGILLEEIRNPEVPIHHPILGLQMIEPSFDSKRFTTLLELPVKEEKQVLEEEHDTK